MIATRRLRGIKPFSAVVAVLAIVIACLIVYPLLGMVVQQVFPHGRFAWSVIRGVFVDPEFWIALKNTVIVTVLANLIAVPVGCLFAWLNERTDARMGSLSTLLPVIPLLLPPVALAIGWLFLADPKAGFLAYDANLLAKAVGLKGFSIAMNVESWPGMVMLYVLYIVPQVYVLAAAAFRGVDPSLEEAARMSGSKTLRVLTTVSLPAIRQGIGSAILMGTIAGFGLYAIPAIVGVPARITVLSVYIYQLVSGQYPPQMGPAVVIGLLMVVVIAGLWLLKNRWSSTGHSAQIGGRGVRPNRMALGRWRWVGRTVMIVYVLATSVAPLASLVLVALESYWTPNLAAGGMSLKNVAYFLGQPTSLVAIENSVVLAIVSATVVALVAAILAIYGRDVGGIRERLIGTMTKIPSAVPQIVFAVGVLVTLAFAPLFLEGSIAILFISYVIIYLPQGSIAGESAVQQVAPELLEASRICGASQTRTMTRIMLPLITSGLAAGWALIFAIIMGNLNVAAILSGPSNPVIGYVILNVYQVGTYSQLGALGAIIGIIASITVGAVLIFARPRFDSSVGG